MANGKTNLVILGSGFASLNLVKKINLESYSVSVVSPRNHFLFTPLLPSTTVGTIEFRSIIEPIRTVRSGPKFYQAKCVSIDDKAKILKCKMVHDEEIFELQYDYLVIAVGAINNTFAIPGVEKYALFLKELQDARRIRGSIIDNFERASAPNLTEGERKRLLHFVVVGGGPTGVEFAAELNDLIRENLREWFPHLVPYASISLLEATTQVLSAFDSTLSEYTMKLFKRENILVMINSPVKEVRADEIVLHDGTTIPYGLVVWSTGIGPTELVRSLPYQKNKAGRLMTDDYLLVPGTDNIYAAGDCATPENEAYVATGQVAQQQGKYLAHLFNLKAERKQTRPFHYRNMGMLAYIGHRRALADLPNVKAKGFASFLFWRSVYLTRLVSVKNKILVLFDWIKTSIFGRDVSSF